MKRNYNFDEEELNQDLFNMNLDDAWSEDMDAGDSYYDEKVNQWLMEDFDQDEELF